MAANDTLLESIRKSKVGKKPATVGTLLFLMQVNRLLNQRVSDLRKEYFTKQTFKKAVRIP